MSKQILEQAKNREEELTLFHISNTSNGPLTPAHHPMPPIEREAICAHVDMPVPDEANDAGQGRLPPVFLFAFPRSFAGRKNLQVVSGCL